MLLTKPQRDELELTRVEIEGETRQSFQRQTRGTRGKNFSRPRRQGIWHLKRRKGASKKGGEIGMRKGGNVAVLEAAETKTEEKSK